MMIINIKVMNILEDMIRYTSISSLVAIDVT